MKFSGRALTEKERDRLLGFAGVTGATECAIGYKKMDDGRYYPVARFFKDDSYMFYVSI